MDNQNQQPPAEPVNPPQLISPQPPVSSILPSKSNKLLLIIAVLIVLIAVTTGSYILATKQTQPPQPAAIAPPTKSQPSPTPDITANWKTYTGSQYYVLKIPPKFEVRNEELDRRTFEEERSFSSSIGSFNIRVSRVKSGKQIEEMATDLMPPITVDEIQIDKVSAKRWHGFGGIAGKDDTTILIFEYKNATFLIQSFFPLSGKFDEFPQILQTFKFTEQNVLPSGKNLNL